MKTLEKELYSGVKNNQILEWISAKQAALATSSSNADIMSVGSPTSSNGMFTSTVIHASVNKNALERQAEKERKEKEEAEKQAKAVPQKGSRGTSLSRTLKASKDKEAAAGKGKSPQKNTADLDLSFDRHATVDKITKRVEFIYVPTYQQMRKMILKALKVQARRI